MSSPVPAEALANHMAVLAKTGAGKSFAMRGVVENLLDAGARVCVVDPTGVWHGLRSSASGKRAGYPVTIFGGEHGDLPLAGGHGEVLAEVIGTSSTAAILDTSLLKIRERTRLFADFADALMRKNRGPLHLIIDEAHLFAPQGKVNDPASGEMLHAANALVSGGRSRGLRVVLISQRPAKLHKDSLSQCETLLAMRLVAPQDRQAIRAWIEDNADAAKGQEIISSLATLKTGQGWIWAPQLDLLERISFPAIRTFDSMRAPDGDEVAAQVLAPIDRDAIAEKLRTVGADIEASDPKMLRKRIADLEAELATAKRAGADPADLEAARQQGYQRGLDLAAEAQRALLAKIGLDLEAAVQRILNDAHPENPVPAVLPPGKAMARPEPLAKARGNGASPVPAHGRQIDGRASSAALSAGQAKILAALIQYPNGLTREQLTVLAGYKRSTRDLYLQQLQRADLITASDGRLFATGAGRMALPDAEPLPRGRALQQHWLTRLPAGERKVFEALIDVYPSWLDRDALGERAGYMRSTRDLYLQQLARRQLVETARGEVRAAQELFA